MANSDDYLKFSKEIVLYRERDITLLNTNKNTIYFNDVLALRQEYSDDIHDIYDDNSQIYIIYRDNSPLATVRVIQAESSELDFEKSLSFKLDECYRKFIGSASRLAATKKQNVPRSLISLLIGVVAQDQIHHGIYFDMIVCRESLVPYYKRIGHQVLSYPPIIHPRTKADCHLMLWIMTSRHTRFANQHITHIPDALEIKALEFLEKIGANLSQSISNTK
jgi:hypothetical protein